MTETAHYDTLAECEAFIDGLRKAPGYEWCRPARNSFGKWEVKYWRFAR